MKKGVIYVLTNPSFPEYVKIGYADDLKKRLDQLNRSECLPFAFRAYCVYEVPERLKDKDVHAIIDRINPELRSVETFDGKPRVREFYNITAEDAFDILYNIAKLSGTTDRIKRVTPEGHEISDEELAEEMQNSAKILYTEEDHLIHSSSTTNRLYLMLKEKIMELGGVSIEPKKLYIAFKKNTNFCDIQIQRSKLKITLNLAKGSLEITDDQKYDLRDVSSRGHWGNGDYEVDLSDESQLPDVMELIHKAYRQTK